MNRQPSHENGPSESRPVVAATGVAGCSETRRLLWVDADVARDGALLRTLTDGGFCVRVAHSVREGLAMAQADEHDAVIVGLKLPDIFGLTVLQRLTEGSSVPILVVSVRCAEQILAVLDRTDSPRLHDVDGASRLPENRSIALACAQLAHCETRHELITISVRALLDRQTLLVFLAVAAAVRLALTDVNAAVPTLASRMRDLIAQAAAVPPPAHPKLQQVLMEIERGATRQQERTIAKRCRVSRWYLSRLIFLQTGRHYHDWIRAVVIRAAIHPVLNTQEQFSQIAYGLGYEHLSHFDHDFNVTFGRSPRELRRIWTAELAWRDDNSL
jgi:AraC-like DNA-binding protein/CheY-like chemotaxis protein